MIIIRFVVVEISRIILMYAKVYERKFFIKWTDKTNFSTINLLTDLKFRSLTNYHLK